jgi:hypothetical protein
VTYAVAVDRISSACMDSGTIFGVYLSCAHVAILSPILITTYTDSKAVRGIA